MRHLVIERRVLNRQEGTAYCSLEQVGQEITIQLPNLQVQRDYYEEEYLPDNFEDYYWDDNDKKVYFTDAPTDADIASVRAQISLGEATISELEVILEALNNDQELPEEATGSKASAIRQARQAVEPRH